MPTPDHPIDDEQLLAYAAGDLTGTDLARVADQVSTDPDARRLLEMYRTVVDAVRTDETTAPDAATLSSLRRIYAEQKPRAPSGAAARLGDWWNAARLTVAELLRDAASQPALAGVRGDGDTGHHLRYRAADLLIELQVGPIDPAPRDRSRSTARLIGQVSALNPATVTPIVDVAILSDDAGFAPVTSRSDDSGLFVVRVPAGTYQLRIAVGGDDPRAGVVAVGPIPVGISGAERR